MANGAFFLDLKLESGEGKFKSLRTTVAFRLEPNPDYDQANRNSPFYQAMAKSADGEFVRIGAGWNKTSERGAKYLSIALDDPSFTDPLSFAAFPVEGPEDGQQEFELVWSRPRG